MSDIGFDPRPYCERLAKAIPQRFRVFHRLGGYYLRQECEGRAFQEPSALQSDLLLATIPEGWVPYARHPSEAAMWAFFGPLADERKGKLAIPLKGGESAIYELRSGTLLESIIAAVVESFESGP